jgi:hypothetical protein
MEASIYDRHNNLGLGSISPGTAVLLVDVNLVNILVLGSQQQEGF